MDDRKKRPISFHIYRNSAEQDSYNDNKCNTASLIA